MKVLGKLGAIGLLALLSACAATEKERTLFRRPHDDWSGGKKLGTWLKDCWLDLTDIGSLSLSWGKSTFPIYGNVRVTKYAELGGGGWSGYRLGWIKRSFGVWREERHEGLFAFGPFQNYSLNGCRIARSGIGPVDDMSWDYRETYDIEADRNWHWTDVGASLHVLFIGLEANLSPYEFGDFIAGLFTNWPSLAEVGADVPWDIRTDIADDDTPVSEYDNKLDKFRRNDYSLWPTIWPTTWDPATKSFRHEEIEGQESEMPHDAAPDGGGGWRPILKNQAGS